jgi:hypothetical protein
VFQGSDNEEDDQCGEEEERGEEAENVEEAEDENEEDDDNEEQAELERVTRHTRRSPMVAPPTTPAQEEEKVLIKALGGK